MTSVRGSSFLVLVAVAMLGSWTAVGVVSAADQVLAPDGGVPDAGSGPELVPDGAAAADAVATPEPVSTPPDPVAAPVSQEVAPPTPPPAAETTVSAEAAPAETEPSLLTMRNRHWFGVGLDVGTTGPLPDVGLIAAYEPYTWLRGGLGFGHNAIGFGVKGSLTLINPFIVPLSFTGEMGRFFDSNANPLVKKFTSQDSDIASLRKVGYDYANLLLGLEAGSKMARFYLRAGASFVRASARDFQETLQAANVSNVSRASDPRISYRGPSLKLGLLFFFP